MKKIYSLLHNADVQGAIIITFIVLSIAVGFILTLGK
jgi:hypothetical protein